MRSRFQHIGVTLVLLALIAGASVQAHDIPADVTIQALLKPEGRRLRLVVRAPLQAMRDILYPTRENGLLDLPVAEVALREAAVVWVTREVTVYEDDARLAEPEIVAVRASLPSDDAFRTYETAVARVTGPPLPADTEFRWEQGMLDLLLEYPIQSDRSTFSIEPRWGQLGLRTLTALRFITPDGAVRPFELSGNPGLVRIDPRWHQAALRFVRVGFDHILDGTDHLLFLLCLVIPFRRLRMLAGIVTAFTVAHSVTLIASAFDLAPSALWFPPLIEALIAASIVYMALENIVSANAGHRWALAFGFGLVHGFGFSFALHETLQFAGSHLLLSLLSFNIGVELGQLAVLVVLVPALDLLFRWLPERSGTIILSALVAHTGWHWMIDRGVMLSEYTFTWPVLSAAFFLAAVRWLMLGVVAAGAAWALFALLPLALRSGERVGEALPAAGDRGSEAARRGSSTGRTHE